MAADDTPVKSRRSFLASVPEDVRTVCKYCGVTFRGLGVHVWRAHGITAREYKRAHGLRVDTPLTSEQTQALQEQHARDHTTPERMAGLLVLARDVPRECHVSHNMGAQHKISLAQRNRMQFHRECRQCGVTFVGRSGRTLCDACRDAIAIRRAQPRP